VESHPDPPQGLVECREWVLGLASGERVTRRLVEGRAHAGRLVAQLEGVKDREEAAALTGAVVEVDRAALPPPGEREYCRADLVGFSVRNREGAEVGSGRPFVDTPSGAVMVTQA